MKERKQMTERKERGITLIALVVTIIVLIILATVSINMVVGENGLIKKAEQARDAYEESSKKETEGLNTMLEEMMKETGVGPHGLPLVDTLGVGTSNVVLESTVDAEDVNGNKIVVPRGFFVRTDLGTKVNDGIVIEDKQGNQFVWVPCTEVQYKKHTYKTPYIDDTKWSTPDSGDSTNPWKTYLYRNYVDWKEESSVETNTKSVKNNGGFYVGRYEAGVPDNAPFSISKNNGNDLGYYTIEGASHTFSTHYVNNNTTKARGSTADKESIQGLKPVSKQGVQAWNYINQENAVTVSKNMYNGAESNYGVTSQLIDGIAWDRTVEWISSEKERAGIVTDSKDYGNYNNNETQLEEDVLYAQHVYAAVKSGQEGTSAWVLANKYKKGKPKLVGVYLTENDENKYVAEDYTNGTSYSTTTHTILKRIELSTGAVEQFKLKNIYDMAGNMSEWTTETGYHSTTETIASTGTKYAIRRGGCFYAAGANSPVSFRDGEFQATSALFDIGFRVVLYIK